MLCAKSNRIRGLAVLAVFSALFAFGGVDRALAQEPPLTVPDSGAPGPAPETAIPFNTWLLYPTLTLSSTYSDNYFLSPEAKISGPGFGVTPSLTAVWSDGIHTTTLFGNFQGIYYPTATEINAINGEATFTQKYAPLRDLNFTVLADYTHQTVANGLNNAIASPITSPGYTVLANGNTVLPNGTIVSPSGQIVGQQGSNPSVVNGLSVVNPFDRYTATATVQKIFSDGILTLGTSLSRQDYELQSSSSMDLTSTTFTEDAAFWLGPVFYAYSDGSFNMNANTYPTPDSTAYRIIGGIGTRQFGLFRASAYFGYQGSQSSGFSPAGGDVYGGALTYYPTADWTLSATYDKTINIASGTSSSTQALFLPGLTPVQIPTSSSTDITTIAFRSNYTISPQWRAGAYLAYTQNLFIGSPFYENAWLADVNLAYDIWRNMTLTLDYQYSSIVSNEPLTSTNRYFITISALYKF
jgi:hypothetical protein